MSAPWTNDDNGISINNGDIVLRANRALHIISASLGDGFSAYYRGDRQNSIAQFQALMRDGAKFSYDAIGHHYAISLPSGADYNVTLNGTTLTIATDGSVSITSAKGIALTANSGDIALTASGNITTHTGTYNDSVDNTITVYNQHTHGGVQSGTAHSQPPDQQLT